jgi:hypothetical protein
MVLVMMVRVREALKRQEEQEEIKHPNQDKQEV